MRVLLATMQYGRGYWQGTERYLAALHRGLSERGHEVIFLAGDPEQHGPRLRLGEVANADPLILSYPTRGQMTVRGIPPAQLIPVLRHHRPDVVHLANAAHIGVGLGPAAKALGIPFVITIMDYWWLCPKHTLLHHEGHICDGRVSWAECATCITAESKRGWLRRMVRVSALQRTILPTFFLLRRGLRGVTPPELYRWVRRRRQLVDALASADAVIYPSRTAKKLLDPFVSPRRGYSIPYGLEPMWFDSSRSGRAADRGRGQDEDPADLTIGFAGALAPHKGPHVLLEALRSLGWTSTRVRIAGGGGDGDYAARLRRLSDGLNVEFVGPVRWEQMPEFMLGLDLMVVTSAWPENLPIVVLEARALGVPVIASAVAGIAELISEPRYLFEVNSASSLADRLASWAHERGPQQSARVSTMDEMVEKTLDVYVEVSGRRAVPGQATELRDSLSAAKLDRAR